MPVSIIRFHGEQQVNTYTNLDQLGQSATVLEDGGWVVTWQSDGQDASGYGIYQQRYHADGTVFGSETRVNTSTASSQDNPKVTALKHGGWVVTWQSTDNSNLGVYQQHYGANGDPIGSEQLVNTVTGNIQQNQSITALDGGGWVVTWQSFGQDSFAYNVYQQRYDSKGAPAGGEQRVNTDTNYVSEEATVTALNGGGWVVTWRSFGQDGSGYGVYQQCYDPKGKPVGGETPVNTTGQNSQDNAKVTALPKGGWVVTWRSFGQDSSGYGIYQRIFGADGTPVGGETGVNTHTASEQFDQTVTILNDGGWVVTWTSMNQDGSGYGVYQRRYDADGQPYGAETQVNTTTQFDQSKQAVTALADGGWVVTWISYLNQNGIYQQRYDLDGNAVGVETKVSDYTAGAKDSQSVTALKDGGWLVTWQTPNPVSGSYDIHQQRFSEVTTLSASKEIALGTAGNDLIAIENGGLSAGDSLDAGTGTDILKLIEAGTLDLTAPDLLTGVEMVQGSGGNDVIIADAARLASIFGIQAGLGTDELRLKAGSYDFTTRVLSGIETITLEAASSATFLDKATALLVHSTTNDGAVNLEGDVFTGAERQQLYSQGIRQVIDANGKHDLKPITPTLNLAAPVQEYAEANMVVGDLTAIDPNPSDGLSFSLVNSAGGRFALVGDSNAGYKIVVANGVLLDYEQATSHTVVVRVTDAGGLVTDTAFTISVGDVDPEKVTGTSASEVLKGGKGKDVFSGSGGNDRLWGGLGNDTLAGGTGKDAFVFDTAPSKSANRDTISDFSAKDDSLWLDNKIFTKLGKAGSVTKPAALNKGFFALDKAKDTNDYLIYNRKTGVLSYDADGSGAKVKAVEIAVLKKNLALTYKDFFVI